MVYFFTDLDNTLIFSHRHYIGDGKICIEVLNGKEQGFITSFSLSYLESQKRLNMVPVTTRTLKQFKRLDGLMTRIGCKKALICNGAILINNGEIDSEWEKESLLISVRERECLKKLYDFVCDNFRKDSIVFEYPYMFYIKSSDVNSDMGVINMCKNIENIDIYRDPNKIYFIPRCFSKGNSVKRYIKRFGEGFCIVAGDSKADISMLEIADVGYYPESLKEEFVNDSTKFFVKSIFSDNICRELQKLYPEVIL